MASLKMSVAHNLRINFLIGTGPDSPDGCDAAAVSGANVGFLAVRDADVVKVVDHERRWNDETFVVVVATAFLKPRRRAEKATFLNVMLWTVKHPGVTTANSGQSNNCSTIVMYDTGVILNRIFALERLKIGSLNIGLYNVQESESFIFLCTSPNQGADVITNFSLA